MFLRNRLKYALTYDEVKKITMQRLIKVDGKVRTDKNFPTGFMGKIKFIKIRVKYVVPMYFKIAGFHFIYNCFKNWTRVSGSIEALSVLLRTHRVKL